MKIMKLLASCAMVGALTAVCASGAFADVAGTVTADYQYTAADETAGTEASAKVVVTVADYAVTGDYTVLVLNKDVDAKETNAGVVENADITQIDQWGNSTATIELALPATLADGTYYVRVGGNADGYIDTTFTVGSTGGEEKPETVQKMIGDFNVDEDVTTADMKLIAKCIAGTYEDYEEIDYFAASYANEDMDMTTADMKEIAAAIAGTGGERIWYYADLYYDEVDEVYYIYGDLYEE